MADQTDTPDDQTLTWACLNPGHDQVQWVGDVAMCTHLGCGLTSRITSEYAEHVRAAERRRLASTREDLRDALNDALDRAVAVWLWGEREPPQGMLTSETIARRREIQVDHILAVLAARGVL